MLNVEFKSELRDTDLARDVLLTLGARFAGEVHQTDTYFRVGIGRVKRRETVGQPTQFIVYDRADVASPKISRFELLSEDQAGIRFGKTALPVWLVVRKLRRLFLLDNIRIHLDSVESLGNFLEFEALVTPDCGTEACHAAVTRLREALAPALGEPVSGGYSDMLARQADPAQPC